MLSFVKRDLAVLQERFDLEVIQVRGLMPVNEVAARQNLVARAPAPLSGRVS
jgi:hypothetical protein